MSDGTDVIHFLDPFTYEETGRIEVTYRERPFININELEYIDDTIYANVWPTDIIVMIDPKSGEVVGRADMEGLEGFKNFFGSSNVLNGIAYDAAGDRLFLTGKLWPKLYEVNLVLDD
jgi:glutamine cyclotransferase